MSTRAKKVWVVQQAFKDGKPYDLTAALEFGSLEFLMEPKQRFYGGEQVQSLEKRLTDFLPGDYVLAMGDPAAIGAAVAVIARRYGAATLLVWKGAQQRYYPIPLEFK